MERPVAFESEPSLDELLNDPIVHLVMVRDRISPKDVRATISAQRERLKRGGDGHQDRNATIRSRPDQALGARYDGARHAIKAVQHLDDNENSAPESTTSRPDPDPHLDGNKALSAFEDELAERMTAINNYLAAALLLLDGEPPPARVQLNPRTVLEKAVAQARHANAAISGIRRRHSRRHGGDDNRIINLR